MFLRWRWVRECLQKDSLGKKVYSRIFVIYKFCKWYFISGIYLFLAEAYSFSFVSLIKYASLMTGNYADTSVTLYFCKEARFSSCSRQIEFISLARITAYHRNLDVLVHKHGITKAKVWQSVVSCNLGSNA